LVWFKLELVGFVVFELFVNFSLLAPAEVLFVLIVVFESFFTVSEVFFSGLDASSFCLFFSSIFFFLCSKYLVMNLLKSFPEVAAL